MLKFLFGGFILLHGLVHLLYFGHGLRLFELPGLTDGSSDSFRIAKLAVRVEEWLHAVVILIVHPARIQVH